MQRGRPIPSSSSIISLNPKLDNGVLCIGSRLEHASIALDSKYPIILPSNARITALLIADFHEKFVHSSTDRTLHEIRKLYWIPRGRQVIRKIVKRCVLCKRWEGKPEQPTMAALPHVRTESGKPPFYYCGVEFFGPIEVTLFRRRVKRWGCLFTCMVTRAVHLEMAYGLSTDSFLTALANFENRRGVPNTYYSDNGTNFVGADRELKEWFQALDQATIAARLCRNETSCKSSTHPQPHTLVVAGSGLCNLQNVLSCACCLVNL